MYSERGTEDVDLTTVASNVPSLAQKDREMIEGQKLISNAEAHAAMRAMKKKIPRSDGYTPEFYQFFFRYVGHFLFALSIIGLRMNIIIMSITQRQGGITHIPKVSKFKHLKNWRPLSLFNTSYKIASSCINCQQARGNATKHRPQRSKREIYRRKH